MEDQGYNYTPSVVGTTIPQHEFCGADTMSVVPQHSPCRVITRPRGDYIPCRLQVRNSPML